MNFKREIDKCKLMRAKLRLVSVASEKIQVSVPSDKYSYLFDHNYADAPNDDRIIDDLTDLDLSNPCRGIIYKGKYLR